MKKLLILDLDETLLYATKDHLGREPDFIFFGYQCYLRPHVKEFLAYCQEHFDLAVWTSSSEDYAHIVVSHLFDGDAPLKFLWSRKRCTYVFDPEQQNYEWVKDLRKVRRQGYRLEHVIMLDDTPEKLRRNYGNLVRINMFEGQVDDRELTLLMPYLQELKHAANIRAVEKRGWRRRFVPQEDATGIK
ncbi:NIF family HAD-type phosphatase [Undibacterium sp. Ji50W]|uniref:NIF family HAD-type phosphatase n=1 Tax=Undibacterium sp. Ji50W TaxID=3413041 RepID=UPI003BF2F845